MEGHQREPRDKAYSRSIDLRVKVKLGFIVGERFLLIAWPFRISSSALAFGDFDARRRPSWQPMPFIQVSLNFTAGGGFQWHNGSQFTRCLLPDEARNHALAASLVRFNKSPVPFAARNSLPPFLGRLLAELLFCLRSVRGAPWGTGVYRHISFMRAPISSFGPCPAERAGVPAGTTGQAARSNSLSSFSGMNRVLEA